MRAQAKVGAAIVFAVFASAVRSQEPTRIFDLAIPEQVAGLPHQPPRDYEKTNPGLGYSVEFSRPGWRIDVYLYDLRLTSIPDDPNSEVMQRQLAQAKGDVVELERRGIYANVTDKGDYAVDRAGRTRFVCSAFAFDHKQMAAAVDSYLCLTSWNNKFFKIRMTAVRGNDTRAEAAKFVDAWIAVLWPS